MKTARKSVSLLVIIGLLLTLWAPLAVSAHTPAPVAGITAEPAAYTAQDHPLYAGRELLAPLENGEKLCYVYDLIIEAVVNGEEYVSFDAAYTLTEVEQQIVASVVDAVFPESYGDNIGHSYCSVYEDGFYAWFYDWGLTQTQKEEVNRRVAELTADLAGKSDMEKSLILYERLAELNTYDYGVYNQTAYGPLVEGKSVCAGYARTYQLLLQSVGIPCLYVTGTANGGGHAWNVVRLDGEWYYSDCTWDDSDNPYFGLSYAYFNVTYAQMHQDHTLDTSCALWAPKSTATAAGYYHLNGLVVESVTVQQLGEMMKKSNPLQLYVTGNRDAVIDLFFSNAAVIATAIGKGNYYSGTVSTRGENYLELGIILDHRHTLTYQNQEPTCTDIGYRFHGCTECAEKEIEFIDATGHDMSAWWYDEVSHARVCTRCNTMEDVSEHTIDDHTCTECGYVTEAPLNGDANGDGKVNNRDLGILQQFLNEYGVTVDVAATDLNGDGKINNRDLGALQQLLNAG